MLRDLIDSGVAPVVRLETIFRQAADSLIIHNAHRINEGQFPLTRKDATDFFLFVKEEPDEAAALLVDIVQQRIPLKFGLDPLDDIQVLSPMYNGAAGVSNLNQLLQAALNPPGKRKAERRHGGGVLRVGDKVMQTVNNYDKNVYNGDIGRMTAIDDVEQTITVSIDGKPVVYDFLEVDELVHAFAISVHKSQGSEYPCVVVPVSTQHYMMLQRNLLYTAITRARRLVILVGTRRAIRIAINNARVNERYTALDYRLRGGAAALGQGPCRIARQAVPLRGRCREWRSRMTAPALNEIDTLWDYGEPAGSETRFRRLAARGRGRSDLPRLSADPDCPRPGAAAPF